MIQATAPYALLRAVEAGEITPKEFERRALRTSRAIDRIEQQALRDVKDALRDLDREIRSEVGRFADSRGLGRSNINRIIDAGVDRFRDRRRSIMQRATQAAVDEAQKFREDIARIAGQPAPGAAVTGKLAEDLIEVQSETNAAFAEDLRARIKSEIASGVARGMTPRQIAADLVAKRIMTPQRIADDPAAHGALARAERLTRLEIRQVFNAANFAQSRAEQRTRPGIRKTWITQGDKDVRATHQAAGNRYRVGGNPGPIPLRNRFEVGKARLRFPADPSGPDEEIMGCRCFVVEITPDVGEEIVEPLAAKPAVD